MGGLPYTRTYVYIYNSDEPIQAIKAVTGLSVVECDGVAALAYGTL